MNKIITTTIGILFFSGCKFLSINQNKAPENSIKCIEISQTFPHITMEGKVIGYDTPRIHIFYFKNLEMYKIPYTYTDYTKAKAEPEERFFYLVWKRGEKKGLQYYLGDSLLEEFPVDSTINLQWPNTIFLDSTLRNSNVTLISKIKKQRGHILEILYSFNTVRGIYSMTGTILLSYSKDLKNTNFTFSKERDTIKNMKLYKITFTDDDNFIKEYNITMERSENYYKIEEKSDFNKEEVLKLFDKFQEDRKKINDG